MRNFNIIFGILILSIVIQIEAGILDWFRSKPKWVTSIDKEPLIEAFYPKGLRVSISDVVGLDVFGFHGKINNCFKRDEEGTLVGNVTKPTNGRWVFIDENVEFKNEDALHYWIYVKMNEEEHSFSKAVHVIRNLIPHPGNLLLANNFIDERFDRRPDLGTSLSEEKLCKCPTTEVATFAPVPMASNNSGKSLQDEVDINNIATELLSCSFKVDSLNEVVLDLLKDSNMHSKLVLVGKPRENIAPLDEIKQILVQYLELYDLGKKIKTAQYRSCGTYFEMSSIVDKKRILLRAVTDMKNVSYKLLEPEMAGC